MTKVIIIGGGASGVLLTLHLPRVSSNSSHRALGLQSTGVNVHLIRRRSSEREVVRTQAVFECRGRVPDVTQSENPVLLDLLRSGAARPDAPGFGLDVADACQAIDASGDPSERIYALGPVTAGSF
jgi:uncharacterized NAD(P)/FAD-binding protein YdhS